MTILILDCPSTFDKKIVHVLTSIQKAGQAEIYSILDQGCSQGDTAHLPKMRCRLDKKLTDGPGL